MSTITGTRGIPASGKSTWSERWVAEDPANRVRISRDEIRFALFGQYWGVDEDAVTAVETNQILEAIAAGKDIVIDRTNIKETAVLELQEIANAHHYNFQLKEFSVGVEEAIRRDRERTRSVGEGVIRMLHAELDEVKFNELEVTVRDYRLYGFDGALEECQDCGELALNSQESLDGDWVDFICTACGQKSSERI